jgi:hypothetical protein
MISVHDYIQSVIDGVSSDQEIEAQSLVSFDLAALNDAIGKHASRIGMHPPSKLVTTISIDCLHS